MSARKLLSRQTVSQLAQTIGPATDCLLETQLQQARALCYVYYSRSSSSSSATSNQLLSNRFVEAGSTKNSPLFRSNPARYTATTAGSAAPTPFTVGPSSGGVPVGTNLKRDASTQAQQQIDLHQSVPKPYFSDTFRSSELEIVRCSAGELKPKPSTDKLLFGHTFTDHMFRVDWDTETGWSTPLISKVHNIDIHPGAKVLHYALAAFEGAKAFRGYDNKIRLFRLDQNIKRLRRSARRLCLPDFDELELTKCIHRLIQLDQDWIPKTLGPNQLTSLYVRPTILGVDPSLGVAGSKQAILYVLLSPVGPYFKSGFKPVSLYADPDVVRAWPGGAGSSKLGANYAPTIMVQKQAEKLGLQQVLWLFGPDMKITEVGTMNVFVSLRDPLTGKLHLITPPLTDGLILPGITRNSILELANQWDDVVCEERYLTIDEIEQLIHENRIVEMFGSGTACVVCPINSITLKGGRKLRIPHSDITHLSDSFEDEGPVLTKRILKAITDIQYGRVEHPWAAELSYD